MPCTPINEYIRRLFCDKILRSLIAQQYMFEKRFLFSYWRPGKLKNTKVLFEDLSEIILVHLYWRLNFRLADALPLDQLDLDSEFEVSYSPFNKNIPKSSLQMHSFSVMFYTIQYQGLTYSLTWFSKSITILYLKKIIN